MPNLLTSILPVAILLLQLPAAVLLMSRLIKGPSRIPPLEPESPTLDLLGACTAVVPTLNEADRISPCLEGLTRQSYELREAIVVDSYSVDGTGDLVKAAAEKDPRFRLINDDPLPAGWVGRPWALNWGFLASSQKCEWILGIDADTVPHRGLIASLLKTAAAGNYDLISLSPQFILKYPGELWLQPALLMTLVYRFGPTGTGGDVPERVMANGQCFLCKREVLVALGGYEVAKGSFCDDVTLARYAAAKGFKVGFLDGAKVLQVRMYEGAIETWNEWGRSLDLKDAASSGEIWGDLWLLLAVQGLPVPIVLWYLLSGSVPAVGAFPQFWLWGLNVFLVAVRSALCLAIAPSYDTTQASGKWLFWLSPLADPLAFLRILISAFNQPTQWRGRKYE
ncbi:MULTISPECIES: 2'-O-glycosyltransferase CruG [Microcoleaceae]|uniref:2'-O-glycosyltransferase CruG n=1 Tax=Microcoleaceae TaxID=1892252 RepID=UPI00187DDCA8|nr:glycosyltransferase family 2 protein [Tychonema sp. LEGE 06208]MBE9165838.1 glycosyltransferase [Tychonema sp. LEGE 06208]